MTQPPRPIHLGLFLLAAGHHTAGWRLPDAESGTENIDLVVRMAQRAEAACFDLVFFGDRLLTTPDASPSMITRPDPVNVIAALSLVTRHIGLAATASTTYHEPYNLARMFATVDKLSRGRAAWNIVTTFADGSVNVSRDRHPDHAERYAIADEFVHVVKALWHSWEPDAYVQDKTNGIYVDTARMHRIDHRGAHFQVQGPLNVTPSEQGHPVLIQAGSSGAGQALAAKYAEVVFTAQQTLADGLAFYDSLRGALRMAGRPIDACRVMPGLMPIIGRTEREARDKLAALEAHTDPAHAIAVLSEQLAFDVSALAPDGPLPDIPKEHQVMSRRDVLLDTARKRGLSVRELAQLVAAARGHQVVVGTPEQVVQHMIDWVDAGAADGFNIMPASFPGGLDDFVEEVVPRLQERQRARSHYTGTTLRSHLGLALPAPEAGAA